MPSLVVERGQERGLTYALDPSEPAICGREPSNAIVISDPAASRRHYQIVFRQGRWYVQDLGSRNGTYLNEEQLDGEAPLDFGSRIQVGETVFSFLEEEQDGKGKLGGLTGKTLGGYLILERVGRGGMGTVYRARQISLNRIVALKILSSRLAKDPQFIAQFVAEARAAGALNHPNVVQVFDVGETNGLHFFSMEFMEHGAVQDAFAEKEDSRYPWTEALPLIMDAAEGLVFAERRGIIHRDIKPDNLMLSVDGSVKIADLGLATRTDAEGDGKIFGTPHFVSPEQAQGKQVTHAADIYSLGATFYRIVAGRNPFSGKTVKEILRQQIHDDPTPITQLVDDFPADLAAILSKMMAKKVEDRYQSASELLEDLRAFELAHKIELAGGRKSNKPLMIALGVVVVALLAVIGYFVTREPEKADPTIIIQKEPATPTPGDTGPKLTDDRLIQGVELQVQLAKANVTKPAGDVSLENKDAWLAVAASYESLRAKWDELIAAEKDLQKRPAADTSATVQAAAAEATSIRETLQRLEEETKRKREAADTWWSLARGEVDGLVQAGTWSQAVEKAKALLDAPEAATHLPLLPDAKAYLEGVAARVKAAVEAQWATLEAEATKRFQSGDPAGALKAVDDWATALEPELEKLPDLAGAANAAETWVETNTGELTAQLEKHIAADRQLFLESYRAVRHIGPHPGDPGDANLVFSFRFGAAADALEKRAASARTYLYQDLFARKVADLRAMQAAFDGFVGKLLDLYRATETIDGLPGIQAGAKATLKRDPVPDATSFTVQVTIRGGRLTKPIDWAELSSREFGVAVVQPKLSALEPPLLLGLARLFLETDEPELAEVCMNQALRDGAPIEKDDETRLRREIAALKTYHALIADDSLTPADRIAAVDSWRSKFAGSDAYVLHDGRAPDATGPLFSEAVRSQFLDRFGARPQ